MAMSTPLSLNSTQFRPQIVSSPSIICSATRDFSLRHFYKHLKCTLKLSSSHFISSSSFLQPILLRKTISTADSTYSPSRLSVFAAKGYKMKTHKASAKRFRVTGKGKIVRRRAGKQHLLAKKTTKRKLRLSKLMVSLGKMGRIVLIRFTLVGFSGSFWHFFGVFCRRSDYDNVVGALPYLKVNRNV